MAFTIKELETLTGVKAHTIRIWEQRYRFLKPSRTATNIRSYNNEELKTLLTVALLNRYGYKISRIDEMQAEQRAAEVLGLRFEEARQESLVNKLIGCMVDLDNFGFEGLLNGHLSDFGLEETLVSIIFRFLEKTGILWQTGRVNPAHEHVVSNLVRQKIIAGIESLQPVPDREPRLMLFLPEGEFHELGLLYVFYLLRKRGCHVLYLGANMPLKDTIYVGRLKKPGYCYLHLTSIQHRNAFQRYLNGLAEALPNTKVLLSGYVVQELPKGSPGNVVPLQSLSSVLTYISGL